MQLITVHKLLYLRMSAVIAGCINSVRVSQRMSQQWRCICDLVILHTCTIFNTVKQILEHLFFA